MSVPVVQKPSPVADGPAVRAAVSVAELKRAWLAVQSGQFLMPSIRSTGARRAQDPPVTPRLGQGHPLSVVGCAGSTGASTVALALATAAGSARLIECCTASASGLAAASTAELGSTGTGWARGRRDQVAIERTTEALTSPTEIPEPLDPDPETDWTILDVGWDLGQVLRSGGWLGETLRGIPTLVAVTTPTVPGMRRLEVALAMLPGVDLFAAVVGPPRRRWPRQVDLAMGPLARTLDESGAISVIPHDSALAVRGLDSRPLPAAIVSEATKLLALVEAPPTRRKGTSR